MSSIWTVRRSATDAKLTGLCGGVAQHWGVDPVLVRVGCVLLALSGGIGLVLYLAGWLLIPVEGKDAAPVDDFFGASGRRWPKEVWIALVVVACLVVFAVSGSVSPFGVGPAVILAVIWYFGFYKKRTALGTVRVQRQRSPTGGSPGPAGVRPLSRPAHPVHRGRRGVAATDPGERAPGGPGPGPAGGVRVAGSAVRGLPHLDAKPDRRSPSRSSPSAAPSWPRRTRSVSTPSRSRLCRPSWSSAGTPGRPGGCDWSASVVLGLALTALGILDSQGITIPLAAYFGAALLVVGLTLVAATWWGRARGLLPVGLLLLVGVLITSSPGPMRQIDALEPTTRIYTQVSQLPRPVTPSRSVG